MKTPLYLFEGDGEKAPKDETEKIEQASTAIRNVLRMFNKGKKKSFESGEKGKPSIPTGVDIDEQLQHDFEASRATAREQQSLNRDGNTQSGNPEGINDGGIRMSENSRGWKKLAHKLALQLQRVLGHMRLQEFAHEHEKAALKEEMFDMARHEQTEEDPEDDDDEAEDMNELLRRRIFDLRGPRRKKAKRNELNLKSASNNAKKV